MRTAALFGMMMLLALGSTSAMAHDDDDNNHGGHCPGGRPCEPKKKDVCFNVQCDFYNADNPVGFRSCKAAARFHKNVTRDGGEIQDDSNSSNNPEFEVNCEGVQLYNNSSHRYTDLLGTRIQGQSGPFPAILLPRGSLHSGANGTSGDHVSPSILEIDSGSRIVRTYGSCHIWTGEP
jgi:hypothetical protein